MIDTEILTYIDELIDKLNIKDYVGVLLYGSYVNGRFTKSSDLDIMIIKDNYETQDCGSLLIKNIRVEYFIQDLNKLYELTKNEIDNNNPAHLTKFANCKIIFDTDKKIEKFIEYAKKLYNIKIIPSFDDNDKFQIFSINNKLEDLNTLINDDLFYAVYYVILENIRVLYAKINGIIELPIMKIEKMYNDTDFAKTYIASPIHNLPDQKFINIYLKCLKLTNKEEMFQNIKKLYNFCFENLDFKPQNFCLKFLTNPPFKV